MGSLVEMFLCRKNSRIFGDSDECGKATRGLRSASPASASWVWAREQPSAWGREAAPGLRSARPQLETLSSWSSPSSGVSSTGVHSSPAAVGRGPSAGCSCSGRTWQLSAGFTALWAIPRSGDGGKPVGLPPVTVKSRRVFSERL